MIEFPRDPQNVIPTSSVKIVGLGGAGVPAAFIHLAGAVPVAERDVVDFRIRQAGEIDAAMVDVKGQVKAAIDALLVEMKSQGILAQSAPVINL